MDYDYDDDLLSHGGLALNYGNYIETASGDGVDTPWQIYVEAKGKSTLRGLILGHGTDIKSF